VVAQINHGGMQCSEETVEQLLTASDVYWNLIARPAHAMLEDEVLDAIAAFGQAARRVKEAGFDGVQLHGAHGYLIGQFLSPLVNRRKDRWGGSPVKRMQFLRDAAQAVRAQVGPDYPLLIKLGLMDGVEGGLPLEEGLGVLSALPQMGIDGVEISGGISGEKFVNIVKGIKPGKNEAYYLPWAQQARALVDLPILLVGGFRSGQVMEEVLESGTVDFISLCRPLISEPDLPIRLQRGLQKHSVCISGSLCYPLATHQGISCRCKVDRSIREEVELQNREVSG
jgi:2,4-dienoyl-CoA reductase-like NADH-dependent reductase (Old Yellow Enzyme family)